MAPKRPGGVPESEFYEAYGRAMMAWQSVEHSLFRIYRLWFPISVHGMRAAGAAFYSQRSFGGKLGLCIEVAKTFIKDADKSEWEHVVSGMKKLEGDRNAMAHLTSMPDISEDGSYELVLAPALFVPQQMVRLKKRYDTDKLIALRGSFETLAQQLRDFEKQLENRYDPPSAKLSI